MHTDEKEREGQVLTMILEMFKKWPEGGEFIKVERCNAPEISPLALYKHGAKWTLRIGGKKFGIWNVAYTDVL